MRDLKIEELLKSFNESFIYSVKYNEIIDFDRVYRSEEQMINHIKTQIDEYFENYYCDYFSSKQNDLSRCKQYQQYIEVFDLYQHEINDIIKNNEYLKENRDINDMIEIAYIMLIEEKVKEYYDSDYFVNYFIDDEFSDQAENFKKQRIQKELEQSITQQQTKIFKI